MYIYVDIANVRCRWDINVLSSLNLIDLEAPRKRRNFRQLINQRILIISAMLNFARSGIKDPYLPVERPSVFFPTSRVEAVPIISLISITDIASLYARVAVTLALRSLWQSTFVELIVKKISLLCLSLTSLSLPFFFLPLSLCHLLLLSLYFFTVVSLSISSVVE